MRTFTSNVRPPSQTTPPWIINNRDIPIERDTKHTDYVTVDGLTKIWYEKIEGDKRTPAFVFVHGHGLNSTTFTDLSQHLNDEKGHRVTYFDLAGHEKSDPYLAKTGSNGDTKAIKPEIYTMDLLANTLDAVINAQPRQENVILVGHSLGGMIALQYAVNHTDRVKGLVLISSFDANPIPSNPPLFPKITAKIKQAAQYQGERKLGEQYQYNTARPTDEEIILTSIQHTHPKAFTGNYFAMFKFYIEAYMLNTPSLVIRGGDDPHLTHEMAMGMHKRLRNSRLITIQNYGHNVHMQNPKAVTQAVMRHYNFLTGK